MGMRQHHKRICSSSRSELPRIPGLDWMEHDLFEQFVSLDPKGRPTIGGVLVHPWVVMNLGIGTASGSGSASSSAITVRERLDHHMRLEPHIIYDSCILLCHVIIYLQPPIFCDHHSLPQFSSVHIFSCTPTNGRQYNAMLSRFDNQ